MNSNFTTGNMQVIIFELNQIVKFIEVSISNILHIKILVSMLCMVKFVRQKIAKISENNLDEWLYHVAELLELYIFL